MKVRRIRLRQRRRNIRRPLPWRQEPVVLVDSGMTFRGVRIMWDARFGAA
jgi:hypothetical protein